MTTATSLAIEVGSYVRPAMAPDPNDPEVAEGHAAKGEGRVWAVERTADEDTGEVFDLVRTLRVTKTNITWGSLRAEEVGTVDPPSSRRVAGDVKLLAFHIAQGKNLPTPHKHFVRMVDALHALSRVAA